MTEKEEHVQELNQKGKDLEQLHNIEVELHAAKTTLEAHISQLETTMAQKEER